MGRYDPPRSVLAAVAAGLGLIGAYAATADHGIGGWQFAGGVLGAESVAAASLALLPGGRHWSDRRHAAAAWLATLGLLIAVPLELFASARAACACGGSPLVSIAGVAAQWWVVGALVAVPILLALATAVDWDRRPLLPPRRPA